MIGQNLSFDEAYDAVRYSKSDRPTFRPICESDDEYVSSVKAGITIAGGTILAEDVSNAVVKYSIEINYRQYGIGGVHFSPIGVVSLDYTRVDADGNEDRKSVDVDVSAAEIEWVAGDGVYPIEIEVVMDKAEKVTSVKMVVSYWKP